MPGSESRVDVLTVSRRPTPERAVQALGRQNFGGHVRHIVLVDGHAEAYDAWSAYSHSRLHVTFAARTRTDRNGPQRLAELRNQIVELSSAPLVTFLDDDNSWASDHLSTLIEGLTEYDAVHCERLLFNEDGSPYLLAQFPWGRAVQARRSIWRSYRDLGVVERNSNRLRDRVGLPHSHVDLGEWLVPRALAVDAFNFAESAGAWQRIVVEDHAFADRVISRATVGSTCQPTLHYFLGGYSNRYDRAATLYWERADTRGFNR